jgi:hypothetical protein
MVAQPCIGYAYAGARPFPHAVLDEFFDPALLETVLS